MRAKAFNLLRAATVLAALACTHAVASGAPLSSGEPRPLLMVGDSDYRPLSYLSGDTPRGLDVEIGEAVAAALKRPVRVELMGWERAQEKLRAGEADVILGMTVTSARRASYDFTDVALEHEFAFFVRTGELRASSPADLVGRKVGVTRGGYPQTILERAPGVSVVPVEDYRDAFARLGRGELDAVAADLWVGAHAVEADHLAGITVAGPPFARQPYAMAVRKGDAATLADLNRALAQLERDGTLARIRERWRPSEIVFASRQKVRWVVGGASAAFLLLVVGGLVLWIGSLKRHLARQRRAEAEREEAIRELEGLRSRLEEENLYLREEIQAVQGWAGIVGESDALRHVFLRVRQVASSDTTVLVQGETGVGKELVARALHDASPRAHEAFVRVNCAALPASIVESELFGHVAGAFTGATRLRKGRFELAHRGTLFLDEVGELPLELQAKLLRVLQEGELERVGSSETIRTDVRVVVATNRDLRAEVSAGRFREDLYYRLAVFPVTVPPLRDRREDIPLLVQHFVPQLASRAGREVREVPASVLRALTAHAWPGNVRELRNVLERAVLQCTDGVLRLPEALEAQPVAPGARTPGETLHELERAHIEAILERTHGRVSGPAGAAGILGINPSTLRSRMKKLGIGARRRSPPAVGARRVA